ARMETPVIYFYTNRPRSIDVEAEYVGGSVTESYPWKDGAGSDGNWRNLLVYPPGALGRETVEPPVGESDRGNHYYHAREVPDAAMVLRTTGKEPQAERFIFYRGAGPMSTDVKPILRHGGELTLMNNRMSGAANHLWALQVAGGKLRWAKLPAIPARNEKNGAGVIRARVLDWEEKASGEALPELGKSFIGSLVNEGLTLDEAAAMVKTWSDSWFVEPGTRVFRILPREVVDDLLPLKITPEPDVVERVFVHRMELLAPEARDLILGALENEDVEPGQVREIAELGFGRFRTAAVSSAAAYRNQQFAAETARRQQNLLMAGADLEMDLVELLLK
ncbi:MAG: hypothetical protein AAGJ79_15450, partial [Verrucomicrobiota bacterium]